jgi:hypothetical protein
MVLLEPPSGRQQSRRQQAHPGYHTFQLHRLLQLVHHLAAVAAAAAVQLYSLGVVVACLRSSSYCIVLANSFVSESHAAGNQAAFQHTNYTISHHLQSLNVQQGGDIVELKAFWSWGWEASAWGFATNFEVYGSRPFHDFDTYFCGKCCFFLLLGFVFVFVFWLFFFLLLGFVFCFFFVGFFFCFFFFCWDGASPGPSLQGMDHGRSVHIRQWFYCTTSCSLSA